MCSLRVRATSVPSGATTIAVLKPRPSSASARSYSDACTWTPCSAASARAKAVVGPSGTSSGAAPTALGPSAVIAKYGDSVSSCRQTSVAPSPAASATPAASAARGSPGSGCQRSCTRPTRSGARRGSDTRAKDSGGAPTAVISFGSWLTIRSLASYDASHERARHGDHTGPLHPPAALRAGGEPLRVLAAH